MEKLDLKKQYAHLYKPRHNRVTVVDVPAFKFVLLDGAIEAGQSPGTSPAFQHLIHDQVLIQVSGGESC